MTISQPHPLSAFQTGAFVTGTTSVMPLLSTEIAVTIAGGLAEITTRRVFTNPCSSSIEASITLPIPIDAVVLGLRAELDGRTLVGVAKMRAAARDQFEQAIDDGKTAVLHEELIRGIHRISVGHVPPGKEVMVETVYGQVLTCAGGPARLRIPNTVGDVYGRSPLAGTDDLITSPS
ncbi:MAG: VIT domain-containing protein, partial [Rhodospirillaceae bacterium]